MTGIRNAGEQSPQTHLSIIRIVHFITCQLSTYTRNIHMQHTCNTPTGTHNMHIHTHMDTSFTSFTSFTTFTTFTTCTCTHTHTHIPPSRERRFRLSLLPNKKKPPPRSGGGKKQILKIWNTDHMLHSTHSPFYHSHSTIRHIRHILHIIQTWNTSHKFTPHLLLDLMRKQTILQLTCYINWSPFGSGAHSILHHVTLTFSIEH